MTPRQQDAPRRLVAGRPDKVDQESAAALCLTWPSASKHVAVLRAKLGVLSPSTSAAVLTGRDRLV